MESFFNTYKGLIAFLLTVLPVAWSATQYIHESNRTTKLERFRTYSQIIVDIADGGRGEWAASQRLLIFEARSYPEYAEITCREFSRFYESMNSEPTKMELQNTMSSLRCDST